MAIQGVMPVAYISVAILSFLVELLLNVYYSTDRIRCVYAIILCSLKCFWALQNE